MVELKDVLRKWREDEGLTQRQVAYLLKALIESGDEPVSTWDDVRPTLLNTVRARAWELGWTISTAWGGYALRKGKACVGYADLDDVARQVHALEAKSASFLTAVAHSMPDTHVHPEGDSVFLWTEDYVDVPPLSPKTLELRDRKTL